MYLLLIEKKSVFRIIFIYRGTQQYSFQQERQDLCVILLRLADKKGIATLNLTLYFWDKIYYIFLPFFTRYTRKRQRMAFFI